MTAVNVIFGLYNRATDTGQQQMKAMKYAFFSCRYSCSLQDSYPAGLTYYYFLSTLISIVITFMFKQFIDDDKLLAQLEERKNRRKSGFIARWKKRKNAGKDGREGLKNAKTYRRR